ncbi:MULTISPECIES: DedA family protein [unclassified Curtobacterium]|uniref:DedA family protein n=1 Tax=unclassified Curtobacterium TaxID=257496 RepID=UPI003A801A98
MHLLDAASLLHAFGPWVLLGIGVVVFIESGVLFPFLPGDSLIVTAAILSGGLGITAWQIVVVGVVAAFLGDQVGFWIGRGAGRRLFRDDARVLKTSRLHEAESFFARYGALSLVLGRFVPVVRTYVPLAAGTADVRWRRFTLWNALGGTVWVVLMTLVGVLLGGIPFVAHNIDLLALVIVVVSVLPVVIGAVRARRGRRSRSTTS